MTPTKIVLFAEPTLKILALKDKIKLEDLPDTLKISEDEVCSILKYLKDNGTVEYNKTMGKGFSGIICFKVTSKGAEVAIGKRKLIESQETNFQQMNIRAPVQNVAQTQGNDNTITQTVDNSQYNVLKQIIEKDSEIDESKKTKLFEILDKFNKLKETGENAYDLIKLVGGIAIKYVPLFFSLIQ